MCAKASREAGLPQPEEKGAHRKPALLLALACFPEEKWASSV
jgi:hypothetical protein